MIIKTIIVLVSETIIFQIRHNRAIIQTAFTLHKTQSLCNQKELSDTGSHYAEFQQNPPNY